jgi:2'-hydroxyisoflavone reductase
VRLLILGGTLFLGRHLVEAARAGGHTLTLFNRGHTAPDLFPEVEQLHGDRDGGLSVLGSREFDAVIDTCGYLPRVVEQSAAHLAERCGFYLFISSLSVYAGFSPGADESAPLAALTDPDADDLQAYYGPLKAECEARVERYFAGRCQHARAGFLVGPYDRVERFPYWVTRLLAGGPTLAPGSRDNPMQWLDVRDLADWLIDSAVIGRAGSFDLTGPAASCTLGEFLDRANAALGARAELIWPGNDFLERSGVPTRGGIPYWFAPPFDAICRRNISRALHAGLRFRPLEDTTRATAAQIERDGFRSDSKVGVQIPNWLTRDRESDLLDRYLRDSERA